MKYKEIVCWPIHAHKLNKETLKSVMEKMHGFRFKPDAPDELIVYSKGNTIITNGADQITLLTELSQDVTGCYVIREFDKIGILDEEAYSIYKNSPLKMNIEPRIYKHKGVVDKQCILNIINKVSRSLKMQEEISKRKSKQRAANMKFMKNVSWGKWTITKNRAYRHDTVTTAQGLYEDIAYIRVDYMLLYPCVSSYSTPEDVIEKIAHRIYNEQTCKYRIVYKRAEGVGNLKENLVIINVEKTKNKCVVNGVEIPKNRVAMAIKLLASDPKADIAKLNEFNTEQLEIMNKTFKINYFNEQFKTVPMEFKVVYDENWYVELFGKKYKTEYSKLRKLVKIDATITKPELVYLLHLALNLSIKKIVELLNRTESVHML